MTAWGAVGTLFQGSPDPLDDGTSYLATNFLNGAVYYTNQALISMDVPLAGRGEGWGWFGLGVEGMSSATAAERWDWINDTIKIAIVDTLPNQDTAQFWSDISAHEVSGTGYTAGGQALTSKTLTYSASPKKVSYGCADPTWSGVSFTAGRYAIIYKDTGTGSTSPLIAFFDLGAPCSPAAQDFSLQFGGTALYAVV